MAKHEFKPSEPPRDPVSGSPCPTCGSYLRSATVPGLCTTCLRNAAPDLYLALKDALDLAAAALRVMEAHQLGEAVVTEVVASCPQVIGIHERGEAALAKAEGK